MKTICKYLLVTTLVLFTACGSGDDESPTPSNDCTVNPVVGVVASKTDAGAGQANGSVTINATGGSGTYMYAIDGGTFQNSRVFSDLAAGSYTITVEDSNGCSVNVPVTVVEISANAPSFATDIQPIVSSRCATASCHVPNGSAPFPLQNHAEISSRAGRIKIRTQAQTMPPSGSTQLTGPQITLLAAWVDAGAPNN